MFVQIITVALALSTSAFCAPQLIEKRDLACSSKATGELHLYTTLQAPNPPAVGPDGILLGLDPVRDANNHPILQRYNEVYDKFSWYECDSKAMGYTVSDNLSFGQIRKASDASQCLTVDDLKSTEATITAQPCITTDDASLVSQFWSFKKTNGADGLPVNATFLGKAHSDSASSGYYSTEAFYLGGNQGVELRFVDAYNERTPYQIVLTAASG
ncbi:hypothetical protein PLICRDRAFT_463300 [Plicaturopsis crispa FD-325 SS-3]|nr:hypothetical protein PLICRDRAFT_463300 [Plicaturopsis crispa FD-325 SS-3]